MKNSVLNKIISSTLLSAMLTMSYSPCVFARGFHRMSSGSEKIALNNDNEDTILLKGDISLTSKDEKVSLSLKDSDVEQVLRMFADIAGMNIVFHDSVSNKITLDIVDMPVNDAFNMVMELSGLTYNIINGNTLIIAQSGADIGILKQGITFVPLKYVEASLIADFLNNNIFGMKKPGLSGTNIVSINPVTNELMLTGTENDVAIAKKVIEKFDKKPAYTTFKVNYTTPAQMAEMICNTLMPTTSNSVSENSKSGRKLAKGGFITGAASGSGLELGTSTVACTSKPSSSGDLTSLDLQNFSISYQEQNGLINMIGGSEDQIAMVGEFIKKFDRKIPQAYLEVSIIELTETGSKELTNTWQFHSGIFNFTTSGGSIKNDVPFWIFGSKEYAFVDDTMEVGDNGKTVPVQYMVPFDKLRMPSSMSLKYSISYALSNAKARTVANPRVLVTNGESSTIDITHTYVKSTTSESITSLGSPIVSRKPELADDAGVKLDITPFISPDGYVTMNISPSYTVVGNPVMGNDDYGSYIAATLTSSRSFDLKNVRIKDGETLVIAGMIMEDETKAVSKVPFLGDIPVLGSLFRSSSSNKSKSEMIVMITPKIIYDDEDL